MPNARAVADRQVALEHVPAAVVPSGVAARAVVDALPTELGRVGLGAQHLVAIGDLGQRDVEHRDRERRGVGDHVHDVAQDPSKASGVAGILERLAHFFDDEVDAVPAAHRFRPRRGLGRAQLGRRFRDEGELRLALRLRRARGLGRWREHRGLLDLDGGVLRNGGREGFAGHRRRDQLAREIERLARVLRHLLARDEGAEQHADGMSLRDQTRDEKTGRGADPFGLIWHRPVEREGAVGGQRVVGEVERGEASVVQPRHPADLHDRRVVGGRLPHDGDAHQERDAVEEDAQRGLDRRRHGCGVDRRRLRTGRRQAVFDSGHALCHCTQVEVSSPARASVAPVVIAQAARGSSPVGGYAVRGSTEVRARSRRLNAPMFRRPREGSGR